MGNVGTGKRAVSLDDARYAERLNRLLPRGWFPPPIGFVTVT